MNARVNRDKNALEPRRQLLGAGAAKSYLNIGSKIFNDMVRDGRLQPVAIVARKRKFFFYRDDLDRLIEERKAWMDESLSLEDAAAELSVSIDTIRNRISSKKLTAIKIGRATRIDRKEWAKFLEQNKR